MIEQISQLTSVLHHADVFNTLRAGTFVTLVSGERIHIKISPNRITSHREYNLFTYSFVSEALVNGIKLADGHGTHDIELVALAKSISEAFERAIYRHTKTVAHNKFTTNGWASHINEDRARVAAENELFERDAVLAHWLKQVPFIEITDAPTKVKRWVQNQLSHSVGYHSLRILFSTEGFMPTLTAVLMNKSGNGVLSHSTGKNPQHALEAAISESCRLANLYSKYDRQIFESEELNSPVKQMAEYAYDNRIPNWIFGQKQTWMETTKQWKDSKALPAIRDRGQFKLIVTAPLFVGYYENPELQDLFYVSPENALSAGIVNLKRLGIESGSLINKLPHIVA